MPVAVVLVVVAFVRIIMQRWFAFIALKSVQFWAGLAAYFVAGNWSGIMDFIEEWTSFEEIKQDLTARAMLMIAQTASARIGLQLSETDPLSVESISNAIGLKIGVTLRNVTDREITLQDFGVYLASQINIGTGAHFDSLWPVSGVGEQVSREVVLGIQSSLMGQPSWVPVQHVNSLVSLVKQLDGVFVNRTEKTDRAAMLNRLHQAKYALTHHRAPQWPWVENVP